MDHANIWNTVQDTGEEGFKKNSCDEKNEASLTEIAGNSTEDLTYSPPVEDEQDHPISLPMLQRSLLQAIENLSSGDGGATTANAIFETTDGDYQGLASFGVPPDPPNDYSRQECEPKIHETKKGDPEKEKAEFEHSPNAAEDDLKRYLEEIRKLDFKVSEEEQTEAEKAQNLGGGDLKSNLEGIDIDYKEEESDTSGCACYCGGALCDRNLDSSSGEEKPNEETEEEMSVVEPTYDATDKKTNEGIFGTNEEGYVKSLAPESDLSSYESDWISEDELLLGDNPSEERVLKVVSESIAEASSNSPQAEFSENERTISEDKLSRVNSFIALKAEADEEKRETINVERRSSQSGGILKIERPNLGEKEGGANYAFGEIIGGEEVRTRSHPDFEELDPLGEREKEGLEREMIKTNDEKSETEDDRIAKEEVEYAIENGAEDDTEEKGKDEKAFSPRDSENIAINDEERPKESDDKCRERRLFKLRNNKCSNDCGDSAIGGLLTEQQHYEQIKYCKNLEMEANLIFDEISRLIENVREEFEKRESFESVANCQDNEREKQRIRLKPAEKETLINRDEKPKEIESESRRKNAIFKDLSRSADEPRNCARNEREEGGNLEEETESNKGYNSENIEKGMIKPNNKETRECLTSKNETKVDLETQIFCKEIVFECLDIIEDRTFEETPHPVKYPENVNKTICSRSAENTKEMSLRIDADCNYRKKEEDFDRIDKNENVELEKKESDTKTRKNMHSIENKEERNEMENKNTSNENDDSSLPLEAINGSPRDVQIEPNGKIVAEPPIAKKSLNPTEIVNSDNVSRFSTNRREDMRVNIFKKDATLVNLAYSRDFDKYDRIRQRVGECCALERRESEINIFSKANKNGETGDVEKTLECPNENLRYEDSEKRKNVLKEFRGNENANQGSQIINLEVKPRGNIILFENVSLSVESLTAENYGEQNFEHEIKEVNYERDANYPGNGKKTFSKEERGKRAVGSEEKFSQYPHVQKNSPQPLKALQSFEYFDYREEVDDGYGKYLEAKEEECDKKSDRKRTASSENEQTYGEMTRWEEISGIRKAEGQTDITNGEKSSSTIRSLGSRTVDRGWTIGYETKREREIKSVQSETSWIGRVVNRGINRLNRGKNHGICASDEAISEYFGETSTLCKLRGCETLTVLHPSRETVHCGSKPCDADVMNEMSNKRRRILGNACDLSFGRENETVATSTKMAAEEDRSEEANQSRECRENASAENKTQRGTGRKPMGGGGPEIKKTPGISREPKNKGDTERKKGWKFGLRMKKFVFSAFGVQRRPAKKR